MTLVSKMDRLWLNKSRLPVGRWIWWSRVWVESFKFGCYNHCCSF